MHPDNCKTGTRGSTNAIHKRYHSRRSLAKARGLSVHRLWGSFTWSEVPMLAGSCQSTCFFQTDIKNAVGSKDHLIDFCKWLLNDYDDRWLEAPYAKRALSEHDISNLKSVARFKEICSGLSQKHFDDAFHLWGGEASKIEYFLTTNINFVRALRQLKNLKLVCKPILPSELMTSLSVIDPEPMPFEYGRRYMLNGRLFE